MDNRRAVGPALDRAFRSRARDLRATARGAGPDDVEDAVQDAFLHTLEAADRAPVRDPVRYLFRTLRHGVIDRLRRRTTRARVVADQPDADMADEAPDAERELIAAERLRRVLAIVDEMPPRRRQMFWAHRVEELTYAQIARRYGVSRQAVEKHMQLAMLQLKRGLK